MFPAKLFLTLLLMAVMCAAATDNWPDFDCISVPEIPGPSTPLSANDAPSHAEEAYETWKDCSHKENKTGSCAKVCWLGEYLSLGSKIGELVDVFAGVKGYSGGNKTSLAAEEKAKQKVQSNLSSCSQKHEKLAKEMDGWSKKEYRGADPNELDVDFGSCDKWKPFFDCVDKALGCPRTKKI